MYLTIELRSFFKIFETWAKIFKNIIYLGSSKTKQKNKKTKKKNLKLAEEKKILIHLIDKIITINWTRNGY